MSKHTTLVKIIRIQTDKTLQNFLERAKIHQKPSEVHLVRGHSETITISSLGNSKSVSKGYLGVVEPF